VFPGNALLVPGPESLSPSFFGLVVICRYLSRLITPEVTGFSLEKVQLNLKLAADHHRAARRQGE